MTPTVQRPPRNGVDVPTLFATLDAVKGAPEIAQFQFRASNEWVSGTHSRSVIQGFYGAGQEDTSAPGAVRLRRRPPRRARRVEPGPDARWSSCCTPSPRASPRAWRTSPPPGGSPCGGSPRPSRATSTCSASSGCPTRVRNGYRQIRVHFDVEGDASPEELAALVERSRRRSAVYDVLVNGTDVQIDVSTPNDRQRSAVRVTAAGPAGTPSSSAPASPAPRPRCCSPAPACGCWSWTAPAVARTPCPRTR